MNIPIAPMSDGEAAHVAASFPEEAGLIFLRTDRGNLPLDRLDVRADITGLTARVELTQDFRNAFDVPLEATYIFPLPDRARGHRASAWRSPAGQSRASSRSGQRARASYDQAIAAGQRAAIAEEERPGVFTMRVGNLLPGETAPASR